MAIATFSIGVVGLHNPAQVLDVSGSLFWTNKELLNRKNGFKVSHWLRNNTETALVEEFPMRIPRHFQSSLNIAWGL